MDIPHVIKFFKTDIWRIRKGELSQSKFFLVKQLRILILTVRGLAEDRCQLRAAALTLYSVLSIVPVVAMLFGIAKGFGFRGRLETVVVDQLEGQEEVVTWIVGFADKLLENVEGGLVAGIGIIILFWVIITILSNIENAFNDIWGVKKPRSFGRKVSDYLSLMLICPILFVISGAATVFITSGVKHAMENTALLGAVSSAILFLLRLLPYCVIWVLFSFLYIFMPNTKINFKSGILAGIIAGTIYQIFQWIYITFQIGVSKYNAIYGSFAALPLFFIWLQISWVIVLFGAEISFAYQNVDNFEFDEDCRTVSYSFKRLLSLRTVHLLVKDFSDGERTWNATQITQFLEVPIRLVNQILYELVASGVVSEVVTDKDKAVVYQPASDPNHMTIKFVIDALERQGSNTIPVAQSEELEKLSESLRAFSDLVEESPANHLLSEI
jgi:membrane protein